MAALVNLEYRRQKAWLASSTSLVTLIFFPNCFDPFNDPKSWILSIAAFGLLGWLAFQIKAQANVPSIKLATLLSVLFIVAITISLIATDNKFIGIFGEYKRRTGFITYVSLVIFLISAAYLFRLNSIKVFYPHVIVVGFLLSTYGIVQHYGVDFIKWSNPYNSVITTLGNPDFAASVMAILFVINIGIVIQLKKLSILRVSAALSALLLQIAISFSQVRQGLLISVLGAGIIILVWIYQKSKYLGIAVGALSILIGLISIFGMLNKGPLRTFFYKASVTYRGDYWRAGWNMFVHHPIFGVGLDRYGAYFRQYRDATESLRRGPSLVSNAAHNVPIQLAATGGVILLGAYIALTLFIFWRGIQALRNTDGSEQILVATFFAAWIAYQAQSIISIDNIGVAVWGYVLGGVVIGISVPADQIKSKISKQPITQEAVSLLLVLIFATISILSYKSETAFRALTGLNKPQGQSQVQPYLNTVQNFSNTFKEPTYELVRDGDLAQAGRFDLAIANLDKLTNADPHNSEALGLMASIYEFQKNWNAVILVRQKMYKVDPYNQANLLVLGEDLKNSGALQEAKNIISLINSFAPNSAEAKQAIAEFGK